MQVHDVVLEMVHALIQNLGCIAMPRSHQGGLGGLAAETKSGAALTCKDSWLVGWGGAFDEDTLSCPVVAADGPRSALQLQGCTVQLHPDSTHSRPAILMCARGHASITATGCKLIGPAPGSTSEARLTSAEAHSTIALVSAAV
jgi:hypothetical protein